MKDFDLKKSFIKLSLLVPYELKWMPVYPKAEHIDHKQPSLCHIK